MGSIICWVFGDKKRLKTLNCCKYKYNFKHFNAYMRDNL